MFGLGQSQKSSEDAPRVGTRQQIKKLVGNVFNVARRHMISPRSTLKEKTLSAKVQAGTSTHTQPTSTKRTFTFGWRLSHPKPAATSEASKVDVVVRESPPAQIIGSCGAATDHLLQTPGLGGTKVLPGQNSKEVPSKPRCAGPGPSSELVIGSRRDNAGSRTFALIIGIDKYQSARKPRLQGAVNDARAMARLLQSTFAVPSDNIRLLCDEAATRSRILAEFKSLIANSNIQRGDAVIIYFAGHGSQAPAPVGWHAEGGMVETICPVDEEFQEGDAEIHGIPDRTIARLVSELSKAKGKNITLIFDCCHSGGIARGDSPKTIYRSAPTTSPLPTHLDEDILLEEQTSEAQGPSNSLSNYVLLAACRPNERARESVSADGKPCGAFSENLFRHLRTCGPATTYTELLRSVAKDLEHCNQHPICEGENKDRPVFDGRIVKQSSKLFTVYDDGEGHFRVWVGSLHGIATGSLFSVLRSQPQFGLRREIGILEARTVFTGFSILQPKDGTRFVIPPQSKATIVSWGPSGNLLKVYPEGMDPIWMDGAALHSPRYQVVTSRPTSDMTIRTTDNNQITFDYASSISPARINQLRPPISFAPLALQHTLNHMNDFHYHLTRTNKSTTTSLKGKIGLRLHMMQDNNALDLFNNHHAVVAAGASFSFTFVNESNMDLFPYLFFFDTNEYSIQKLYDPPAINAEAPLTHGSPRKPSLLRVGSQGSPFGPFSFSIPDGAERSTGFLKLFVTSRQADLGSLEQGSAFTPDTITRSLHGAGTRGGAPSRRRRSSDDAWDACCYAVTIRRA